MNGKTILAIHVKSILRATDLKHAPGEPRISLYVRTVLFRDRGSEPITEL